jgi:PTS system N-acetylglucosamine-specific IIC component
VLTGTSIALTNALDIRDGFGFSAGLFDFLLNWNIATKPGLLIVIGLGYGALYYFLFRFVIRKWNLRTPGREEEGVDTSATDALIDQPMDRPSSASSPSTSAPPATT